ncbi:peptidylprolyl isomerase [bacterium]|nr:MAG: peptidylprolyl isomerase [bacterium]
MVISPDKYVSIHYTLTLDDGEVADTTSGGTPLSFVHGCGQIIPGLEKALEGKSIGDKFVVTVPPEEAYGLTTDEMYRDLPRENFPDDLILEPGMGFTAEGPHGPVSFFVVEVKGDTVVADFSHPLAGKTLTFDVEIAQVEELSPAELLLMKGEANDDGEGCGCGSSCGEGDSGCSPSSCGGGCGCG